MPSNRLCSMAFILKAAQTVMILAFLASAASALPEVYFSHDPESTPFARLWIVLLLTIVGFVAGYILLRNKNK